MTTDSGASDYLHIVEELLPEPQKALIFACIGDLISNGLCLERFSADEPKPTRIDVTHFLAAWCKYLEVKEDACRRFLIDYSVEILSAISTSSASRIKHGTKATIRYVYNSDYFFECDCETNRFKAKCESNCRVYDAMNKKARERKAQEANRSYEIERDEPEEPRAVRAERSERFGKALQFIREKIAEGINGKDLVALLNEKGFKSRSEIPWNHGLLSDAILKNDLDGEKTLERREENRKQFKKTWEFILECLEQGEKKTVILRQLHKHGYKTSGGKEWTYTNLQEYIIRKDKINQRMSRQREENHAWR